MSFYDRPRTMAAMMEAVTRRALLQIETGRKTPMKLQQFEDMVHHELMPEQASIRVGQMRSLRSVYLVLFKKY